MKRRIFPWLVFVLCAVPPVIFPAAGEEQETINIVTYYPSPYGSYQQLSSKVVQFTPADGEPDFVSGEEREGMLYYDEDEGFKYYDGHEWTSFGGGSGITVDTRICTWSKSITGTELWPCPGDGTSCCTPAACDEGWTDLGTFVQIDSVACSNVYATAWANRTPHYIYNPLASGRVVRKCVK